MSNDEPCWHVSWGDGECFFGTSDEIAEIDKIGQSLGYCSFCPAKMDNDDIDRWYEQERIKLLPDGQVFDDKGRSVIHDQYRHLENVLEEVRQELSMHDLSFDEWSTSED